VQNTNTYRQARKSVCVLCACCQNVANRLCLRGCLCAAIWWEGVANWGGGGVAAGPITGTGILLSRLCATLPYIGEANRKTTIGIWENS